MSDQPSKRFEMIYELVRRIPRGKVTTYGVIAKKLLAIESLIEMAELREQSDFTSWVDSGDFHRESVLRVLALESEVLPVE